MNQTEDDQNRTLGQDVDLADYARTYTASYLAAVEDESPDHVPLFYRNHPFSIEVCCMPNSSFCMLFEKSGKPALSVTNQDWGYVMGRVMSGVTYIATVYSHEGLTHDDAVARGKRDAIRDIRALESSTVTDTAKQLEKLITELNDVNKWSKNPVKMAEHVVSRLKPIKQAVLGAGPSVDMMAMIDTVKRYPPAPVQVTLDSNEMQLLAEVADKLESLGEIVKSIDMQGSKIEGIEKSLRRELDGFKAELDKKVAKGLGMILTSSDRKIDKAVGALSGQEAEIATLKEAVAYLQKVSEEADVQAKDPRVDDLIGEVEGLRTAVELMGNTVTEKLSSQPPSDSAVSTEELSRISEDVTGLSMRIKRIEDYLVSLSRARRVRQQ